MSPLLVTSLGRSLIKLLVGHGKLRDENSMDEKGCTLGVGASYGLINWDGHWD